MAELHIHIDANIDGGDPWTLDRDVTVPPDYNRRDIEPFVQHELDKAMSELQREAFGFDRSEAIIRQYDRRMVLIAALLRAAPHDIRNRPIVQRIREVMDIGADELFARFGDESVED
jgi:hypothetical protein